MHYLWSWWWLELWLMPDIAIRFNLATNHWQQTLSVRGRHCLDSLLCCDSPYLSFPLPFPSFCPWRELPSFGGWLIGKRILTIFDCIVFSFASKLIVFLLLPVAWFGSHPSARRTAPLSHRALYDSMVNCLISATNVDSHLHPSLPSILVIILGRNKIKLNRMVAISWFPSIICIMSSMILLS